MDNGAELVIGAKYYSNLSEVDTLFKGITDFNGTMVISEIIQKEDFEIKYVGKIIDGLARYGGVGDDILFCKNSPLHLALTPCEDDNISDLSLSLDDIFGGGFMNDQTA